VVELLLGSGVQDHSTPLLGGQPPLLVRRPLTTSHVLGVDVLTDLQPVGHRAREEPVTGVVVKALASSASVTGPVFPGHGSGQRDLRRDSARWLGGDRSGVLNVVTHERHTMAKYLTTVSYSPEGIKGVMAKGGSARAAAIQTLASGVGRDGRERLLLVRLRRPPCHRRRAEPRGDGSHRLHRGSDRSAQQLRDRRPAEAVQIDEAASMTLDYAPP
jgi:hypothetical protein